MASLVFGILGGFILAIVFGLVARSRIKSSGGRLRGQGMAAAGTALGCVWVVVVAVVLALAATGALDNDNASGYEREEREVAEAVDQMYQALDEADGARVCGELLTARYASLVADGSGKSCAEHLESVSVEGNQAIITVKRIVISGESATVDVTEGGDPGRWTMLKQAGRWRIDDIETDE